MKENPVISGVKPPLAPKPVLLPKVPRTNTLLILKSSVDPSDSVASRQGTPYTTTVGNTLDKSTAVPGHRSSSRNLCETLPSSKSDSTSHSDLTSENNSVDAAFTSPSLQLSPPTPNIESEGCDLVNNENQSNPKQLPSDSETCSNHSSPSANSSFLYSNSVKNTNKNSSSEQSRFSSEGNTPESPMTNTQNGSAEVTLRNKKLSKHTRDSSWSDDGEVQHSRTNSADSESSDGLNNSVRRRISSFLGSFGKGSKTKERYESTFYDYNPVDSLQPKSSDSGRSSSASLNDSTNIMSNNNHLDAKPCLSVNNSSCDRDSNRSSMSDESFDTEPSTKTEETVQESEAEILERRRKECFNVVNEFMTSERVFIDVLKLLCHDFRKAVEEASNLEKNPIIPDSQFVKIINHLPELLFLNTDLLRDIENRIESWDNFPKLADVIVKKGPFLKLYSSYIIDFLAQTELLDECCEKYRKFGQVVSDFEKSDRCKNLTLKQHMLKPVQRIPQYKLLLQNYLKYQELDSPDYADTQVALKIICGVANHNDSSLSQGVSLFS